MNVVRSFALAVCCLAMSPAVGFAQGKIIANGNATAISADGSTVLGGASAPFVWTDATGVTAIGGLDATGISADGSRVIGLTVQPNPLGFFASTWSAVGVWVPLPTLAGQMPCMSGSIGLFSAPGDLSDDGLIASGEYSTAACGGAHACRWIGGMLVPLAESGQRSSATAISGDGQVAGGIDAMGSVIRAALWLADGSEVLPLVSPANPTGAGEIGGLNFDGSIYVGQSQDLAFRRTPADGLRVIGKEAQQAGVFTYANGVSEDGKVVVGLAVGPGDFDYSAFLWTEAEGMHSIVDYAARYGILLEDTHYGNARGVSANGRRICGHLVPFSGLIPTSWIVDLPVSPWQSLGQSSAGVNGHPLAHGFGPISTGQTVDLHLVDAAPNATTWLVLSTQSAPMQLLGGTLVPGLPALIVPFTTDANGQVSVSTLVTAAPPPGSSVYMQWLTVDPAASAGVSFSNALRVDA